MQTHFLFDVLDGYKPFEQMAQESQNSGAVIAASGMAGAQKAHAACAVAARTGRPLLFLCDSERSATQTMEDVSALLGGGVCLLPAREITFYQDVAASREVAYRRIEAMRRALSGEARAIVAPADAMLHRMMPREAFNRNTISLRVGDVTPIDLLIERLLAAGYTREYMVEGKGQFSVRGGIIDVYPADALSAVRIEFFDDELDSIRAVDVMSQRSQGNMQEVVIPPASEAPVPQAGTEALARLLLEALARQEAVAKKGESGKSDDASLADLPLEEGEIAAPEAFTRENRTMERFGVGHKESIKNMKKTVDVLTMSATPIPRTLHMSMVGIRDMSLLETPPQARYPVQTYVMEYQDSVIRDAILREIGRGGQVFFLYNRVGSIDQCYKQLSKLVPEARIAIAHGQMREHALEDVMLDFSQQKFDVLLCTTIIESGLDIPMANTLIIYDADHFGLGQLYQMRGRVGRSNRLAYAYFTVRPGKVLSETAQKRLDAIREFTEFGSGFRIAMRDLELRGAGNLLGPQQSGHLANIGYDLYCKLLEEAVLEAQGEAPKPNRDVETRMDVHVNAYLPAEYVTGDRQRLEVYKRIASITTAAQRDDVEEELVDRFGDEPLCVANLVAVAYLKAMCEKLGIDRVNQADGRIDMRFALNAQVDGQKLFTALNGFDKRLTLNAAPPVTLTLRDQTLNREDLLMLCVKVMERLLARMELSAA